jgi:hypothetical protein
MAYGTIKVDNITFTNGGVDQTVTVSGVVQSISGNITATGTIQGQTIIGTSTVSGATVTGNAGSFTTLTGGSAGFTAITGATVTGTTANFVNGTFSTQVSGTTVRGTTVSGATVTGAIGQFTTLTGGTAGFTTVTGATVTGTTANFQSGVFTTQISGATVTGNVGSFSTITGGTVTLTSGVFGTGTAAAPSIAFTGDSNTGIYSPGADQVAVATNGTGRLFVDASGRVGIGPSSPSTVLHISSASPTVRISDTSGTPSNLTGQILFQEMGTTSAMGRIGYTGGDAILRVKTDGAQPIAFLTNDAERLRITSAGLVGIGTSSPTVNLHVVGASGSGGIQIGNSADSQYHYINFGGDTSSDNAWQIGRSPTGGVGPNNGFYIYDLKNGLTRLSIDASGRLGIGTTTFTTDCTLSIGSGALNFVGNSTAPNASTFIYRPGDNSLGLGTDGSERARIDSSGRLLVGTSTSVTSDRVITPQIQLAGTNQSASAVSVVNYNSGGTPSHLILGSSTGGSVAIQGLVNSGGTLGMIAFTGSDGTAPIDAAFISAEVDGTPGPNDMPGRLVFSTTADGASSPTMHLYISNEGYVVPGTSSVIALPDANCGPGLKLVATTRIQTQD